MSFVKYTKTATFLFPLVDVPKTAFTCDVRNSFERQIMTTRFLNAYMWDEDLEFDFNHEPYIFIVVKPYRDYNFEEFHSTIISMENYVDEYEKEEFIIMIFKIPEENLDFYNMIMQGKYSQLSSIAKGKILRHGYFSGRKEIVASILNKGADLRLSWEKALSSPHPDPRLDSTVNLEGMEVWSRILKENEGLSERLLQSLKNNPKLSPTQEFKH